MNKKLIWGVITVIVVIVIIALVSSNKGPSNEAASATIHIGAVLSLSGDAVVDGTNIKRGLELAKEDLFKKGISVDISYEDDATNAKQTVSALQKVITIDRPDAIIGPTWSPFIDAGEPVIDGAKIVGYAPANTSETHSFTSHYIFFGALRNAMKEDATTKWLKVNNLKRAVIIVDKSGWGDSHILPFQNAVKNVGGTVVLTEEVPYGTEANTYPTIIAKAIAQKADVILWTGYDNGATILIKKLQESGKSMYALMASTGTRRLVDNGTITTRPSDNFYDITPVLSAEFASKFKTKYGETAGAYADNAYDGLMLIVDGLVKKGSNESLADYMHTKTDYKGYATEYKFTDRGDVNSGTWVIN